MLRKWTRPVRRGYRVNLVVVILLCVAVVCLMSFLLFGALADGLAYGGRRYGGRPYVTTQAPFAFWITVALQYVFAVAAFSAGLVMAIKLGRSFGQPDSVGEEPISDSDLESEPPAKRFENRWRYANIAYVAALLLPALYVYATGDWPGDMPPHRAIALAVAPFLVSLGLLEIYTGQARVEGTVHSRTGTPINYWVQVGVWLVSGVALFLLGIGVIPT